MSLPKIRFDYGRLDFNKPITRNHIDLDIYNNKLSFVDDYKKLNHPDKEKLRLIWNDRTMFSYMFLKLDGRPIRLYPYQDLILNDPYRFKYFEAANQIGKSISLDVNNVFNFVHDHGKSFNSAIVSKSLPQATHQMRRIKSLLSNPLFSWKEQKGETDNMSVISLNVLDNAGKILYTNYMIVAPCSEGLLGYDLHELDLDEFEFWDNDTKYFYEQVAEPRTYHTKGDIIIFSNPNGNDSYGAELTRVKLPDKQNKFHVYNFNFLDKPGNVQYDLDLASAGKTRQVIESTLLAVRSISDRNYFTTEEIHRSLNTSLHESNMFGKTTYWFLDVGSKHDQSVLVGGYIDEDPEHKDARGNNLLHFNVTVIKCYPVGYPISRVVGSNNHIDDNDGWHYEKSVREYLIDWTVDGISPTFGVDVTGNSGIVPLFNSVGINAEDITFSGPKKSGMYQRFKYLMEKGLFHRIKSSEFEYQASHLEVKKSARGHLMIHHANEDDLDDVMDACAGFIHLADNPEFIEPSVVMI